MTHALPFFLGAATIAAVMVALIRYFNDGGSL